MGRQTEVFGVERTQLERDYGEFVPSRALPSEPVDLAFLLRRYGGITNQTFLNRRSAIPGKKWGRRVGKRVLYSTEEVSVLDAIDYFVLAGATLKEVTSHWIEKEGDPVGEEAQEVYTQKALDVEAANATTDIVVQGVRSGDLETATERLGDIIATKVEQAVERAMKAAANDPLRSQRLMKEAATNGFLVTTSQIADILGFSKKTVQGWGGDEHHRNGFVFIRVKKGFWRVREQTEEELMWERAAESAAQRERQGFFVRGHHAVQKEAPAP